MKDNIHLAQHEMRTTHRDQEMLYNKHVNQKKNKDDIETLSRNYKKYINSLDGFHASAFDKVISHLLSDNREVIDQLTSDFKHIPDYIAKRGVWDKKKKDILQSDSPSHIKQQELDSLNQSRSKSHNGVIDLFNKLNLYAENNKLANPYPKDYYHFHKSNRKHRKDVADILTRHTTLIENINELKQ